MKAELTTRMLLTIILGAFSIIILSAVTMDSAQILNIFADENACRSSVYANHIAHTKGIAISPQEVNCPTRDIKVKSKDNMEIQAEVAEAMKECWTDFGKGEYELFDEESIFCSVCNTIDFKHEDIMINDFSKYLKRKYVKGKDLSYMEYLMNYETPGILEQINKDKLDNIDRQALENIEIDTSKLYSVIFVYIKGKEKIAEFKQALGRDPSTTIFAIGAGSAAGYVSGMILLNVVSAGTATIVGLIVGGGIGISAKVWSYFAAEESEWASFVVLKEHTADELASLGCQYYPSIQKS